MFSISLADVAVNEFSEDAEVFVETLNGLLSRLGAAGGKSVAAAEACISEVLAKCGQALLEPHARQSTRECEVSEGVSGPECEGRCRRYRKRCRRFLTVCGEIYVERWVYVCEAGHYQTPWEAGGFSLGSETQEPPICCDASGCS